MIEIVNSFTHFPFLFDKHIFIKVWNDKYNLSGYYNFEWYYESFQRKIYLQNNTIILR